MNPNSKTTIVNRLRQRLALATGPQQTERLREAIEAVERGDVADVDLLLMLAGLGLANLVDSPTGRPRLAIECRA